MESPHKMIGPYESKDYFLITFVKGRNPETTSITQSVIDICAEHHGTTLMKYFYAEALKTIQMRMRQISDIQVLNLKQRNLRSSISWIALRQRLER